MSVANRVIKNTGFLYAKMGITMFISLYTTRLILGALGAEDFGIFNVVGGAIAMLGFLHVTMASATQRFMSFYEGKGDKDKQKNIFNVSIILHVSIALILGILFLFGGYFLFNGILNLPQDRIVAAKTIYYFMIVSTMFTVMTVPYEAVINAHENMLFFSVVGIFESILKLIVAFLVVYTLKDKLILYGALMAAISLVVMTIMRVYCHKTYGECVFNPRKYWDKFIMKEMSTFAGWKFLGVTSSMVSQYGLSIVLNSFWGTILNAAQGIANQISGQLMTFSNTMLKALNPVIAKSEGNGNRAAMMKASMLGAKFSYLLLAFFAIPFIIETPFILKVWLKNIPDWAILFTRLQLIRSLIEQLTEVFGGTIAAQGDIKKYSITKSVINIQPIILTSILFSLGFPPYYLYITWIVCWGILGGLTNLYYLRKQCGLNITAYLKDVIVPCLICTSVMLLTITPVFLFMDNSLYRLITVMVFTSTSFILVYYLVFLSDEEKTVIKGLLTLFRTKINTLRYLN